MELHYFFAPTPRQVIEKCADRLHELVTSAGDPFYRPRVVVPHLQAASSLRQVYTGCHGIAMNMEIGFLEEALWDLFHEAADGSGGQRRLTRGMLQGAVLHLLHQEVNSRRCPKPLADYLAESDRESPVYSKKLWQLSNRLAFLFLEYTYQLPDVTRGWAEGKLPGGDAVDAWQAALYHRALGANGIVHEGGERCHLLPDFSVLRDPARLPDSLLILAPGPLSRLHLGAISQLANHATIGVYTTFVGSQPKGSNGAGRNSIPSQIRPWLVPVEANFRLLGEVLRDGAAFHFDQFEGTPRSVLDSVKWVVAGNGPVEGLKPDSSLEVAGAAGVLREAQAVHQSIIHRMKEDDSLLQTDIAVMIPTEGEYEAAVNSVFSSGRSPLRFNLVRANALRESVYAQGVLALLKLLLGDFSRAEAFALFQNPCFQEAAGCSHADIPAWLEDIDRAGIYRHVDRDHQHTDGLEPNGLFTWEQGLRRMRLGHVMDLDEEEMHAENIHPISRESQFHVATVSTLSILIARLAAARRLLLDSRRTLPEWGTILRDILKANLAVPETHPEEWPIRNRLDRELTTLEDNHPGKKDTHPFHVVHCLVEEALGTMPVRKGIPLYGGITVGTLDTLRGVPFRVIYIMGLNAGVFPARRVESSLDIRARTGDDCRITRTDRDRHNFLEAILAAGEALVLTYQSRDLKKDQELFPSSVILQLIDLVESELGITIPRPELPWHGHSQRYLDAPPNGSTLHVNYDPLDRAIINAPVYPPRPLVEEETTVPNQHPDDVISVSINDLAGFLEDPLRDFLERQLGLRGLDDAKAEKLLVTEPFELSPLQESMFVRPILNKLIELPETSDSDLEKVVRRTAFRLLGESAIHHGIFLERLESRMWEFVQPQCVWLRSWLLGHRQDGSRITAPLSFGDHGRAGGSMMAQPPIVYRHKGLGRNFEIRGALPLAIIPGRGGGIVEFLSLKPVSKHRTELTPAYFPGILAAIFLAASRHENDWIDGVIPDISRSLHWCLYRETKKGVVHHFELALEPGEARELADNLLEELVQVRRPDLLPYAIVGREEYIPNGGGTHVSLSADDVATLVMDDQTGFRPSWYPGDWRLVVDSEPPTDVDAALHKRLGFYHHVMGGGK
ncbi:MAG: exodeoxyribonuclease V subunit gamma [Candidatus Sumerlaeia bacterium]|nr:exodeoxyribonuclease V subunit gamma [Candidatus Sumerlaeia bacterium]